MILEDFIGVYSSKMLDQSTTDMIIVDSVYDDILRSVIVKEVKF
jgi:hypothetical protein